MLPGQMLFVSHTCPWGKAQATPKNAARCDTINCGPESRASLVKDPVYHQESKNKCCSKAKQDGVFRPRPPSNRTCRRLDASVSRDGADGIEHASIVTTLFTLHGHVD